MPDPNARLTVTTQGDVTVVELGDKKLLDEVSIMQLGDRLAGLVADAQSPKLVLDFSHVVHMSSSALGVLITLHKRVREKGGSLRLCGIQPAIHEIFVITRLNEIFLISASRQEAVAALS